MGGKDNGEKGAGKGSQKINLSGFRWAPTSQGSDGSHGGDWSQGGDWGQGDMGMWGKTDDWGSGGGANWGNWGGFGKGDWGQGDMGMWGKGAMGNGDMSWSAMGASLLGALMNGKGCMGKGQGGCSGYGPVRGMNTLAGGRPSPYRDEALKYVPPAQEAEIEAFLAEHQGVSPSAAELFRKADPKVQTLVITKGSMLDARDQSAVLTARINGLNAWQYGDWVCRACMHHNFARNTTCRGCSKPKETNA